MYLGGGGGGGGGFGWFGGLGKLCQTLFGRLKNLGFYLPKFALPPILYFILYYIHHDECNTKI